MSVTAKMMIVQPGNKSLVVRNVSGDPLDLTTAGDIVRGNASQPSPELMPNQVDRDFSGASAWTNIDVDAYDETGDLTLTATAADQYVTLPVASAPMTAGKRYRVKFGTANLVSVWTVKDFTGAQTFGTISADGTDQFIEFKVDSGITGGFRLVAVANDSSADFDNFSLLDIGELLYLFLSATRLRVDDGIGGGPEATVITDGSTYNNDVAGKGIDIIFKSGRVAGDTLLINVLDAVAKKDTYLIDGVGRRNNGSCDTVRIGGVSGGRQRGLIRFNIPSGSVQRFINVKYSNIWVYGSKRTSATAKTFEFYEILPPNADWVEGTFCGDIVFGEGFSTWNRKIQNENLPNAGVRWEGEEQGGNSGCIVSGVDYVAERLASVSVSGLTDQWYAYADDSGRLNSFIGRMVTPGITNPGMVSQISSDASHTFDFFSGNYTTDITLRPKMIFIYDETDVPVIKRTKKELDGLTELTFEVIDDIVKSEIPALSNISEVYRSANRVIGKINSIFPGVMETDLAFTRKVVDTTENLTFASADPDTIVTTTDFSASALPGRVAYIYGTANNDGLYYIGSVSTVTITLVGVSKLIAEGPVSATIAIYDVKAYEILPETNMILTHTTSTMTDSGLNDFERMGTKEGDIVILVGSARNDGAYSIASSKGLEITLQSDESLTAVGPSYGRIRIIRPSLAYQFDTENNELKLPDYVREIVKVFENNEELTPRSFEHINNSNNSSELAFNTRERSKIRFPSGIGDSADDEIHVKVKKDIIEFLYPDSISSIKIPASMVEVIIAGTLSLIFAKREYRDDNLFKFNKNIFIEGLKEMADLEIEYEPSAVIERDYDYFPEAS